MSRYKHEMESWFVEGRLPPSGSIANPDRSSTHFVNLKETILVFGPWAVPGLALAKLLGLVKEGENEELDEEWRRLAYWQADDAKVVAPCEEGHASATR